MKRAACSLIVLLAVALAPAADAARTVRLSGTVVSIDPEKAVMILDEVGPWRIQQGRTVVTRRVISFTSTTTFSSFIRVNVPGQYAGDFLEVALEASDVTPGDFATAECIEQRGRLVAVRVMLAEVN